MRTALADLAEALGIPVLRVDELLAFADLVALWNRRTNLVGSTEPRDLAEVLFADALVLSEVLPRGARFIDVGAGAGAPSLPLLILRQDLRAVLVEPRRKRVAFMRTAIGSLGLVERAEVREQRLGDAPLPEADVALSRATFEPAEWLSRAEDLADAIVVLSVDAPPDPPHGRQLETQRSYELPFSQRPRRLAVYSRAR